MKLTRNILIALAAATMLIVNSCQKTDQDNYGTLHVSITDDPFPIDLIEEANVVITKLEIRLKNDSTVDQFITLFEETQEFNLLDLRNGTVAELLEREIPVGSYDLIRLYVDKASLGIKDGGTYEVKVPSGSQTGIKIFIDPELSIAGGLTSDLLLDFNLDKSFVLKGNTKSSSGIKGFNFKPVIRVANKSKSGTIQGMVSDTSAVAIKSASVWIMKDTTHATAYTDSAGFYSIPAIPEGTYSVYSTKEHYDTVKVDSVEIMAANYTTLDFLLTPEN